VQPEKKVTREMLAQPERQDLLEQLVFREKKVIRAILVRQVRRVFKVNKVNKAQREQPEFKDL
jgi:hypothetical protein